MGKEINMQEHQDKEEDALRDKILAHYESDSKIARRSILELNWPIELTIQKAIDDIEKLGADVTLTDAIIKLTDARNLVADYLER